MSLQKRIILILSCVFLFNNCVYFYWENKFDSVTKTENGDTLVKYSRCVKLGEHRYEPSKELGALMLVFLPLALPLMLTCAITFTAVAIPTTAILLPFQYPFLRSTEIRK